MNLPPSLAKRYTKETLTAMQAQRAAHEISQGPVVFQVSRLMVKFGILQQLIDSDSGLTIAEIAEKTNLSEYAVKILIEASLCIGTVLCRDDDKFVCSKMGWFLQNDTAVKIDMDFNHDVNYLGMFHLEEALLSGKPEGLKVFGSWATIYE